MVDSDAGDGPDTSRGADADTEPDAGTGSDGSSIRNADEPSVRVSLDSSLQETESAVVDGRAIEAAVAGGLAGGFQAALVIQLYDTDAIKAVGAVIGSPTLDGGWLATFALGVVFALPFHAYVSRSIDEFGSTGLILTTRSDVLRTILQTMVRRSPYTTVTFGLGNGYGIVMGLLFFLGLLSVWSTIRMTVPVSVPHVTVFGLVGALAWTIYGGTLGLVYGLLHEYP